MPKHMAKQHKKATKGARTVRPLKKVPVRKPTRVKKATTQRERILRKAAVEQQGVGPVVAELQLVDFEALGQEPESVTDVVEIFEVEVVTDAEGTGQSEEPEFTREDSN